MKSSVYKPRAGIFFQLFLCVAASAALVFIVACGKKADPLPPVQYELPVVDDLSARQEGPKLVLNWSLPDWDPPAGVSLKGFYVYRAKADLKSACEGCPVRYQRVDQVAIGDFAEVFGTDLKYRQTLDRGYHYRYKVSAFTYSGREGKDSNIVRINFK